MPRSAAPPGLALLLEAVWHGAVGAVDPATATAAWDLAERNGVEAELSAVLPRVFDEERRRVRRQHERFRANLEQAVELLRDAGVDPVLIKADPDRGSTYSNFDLVVGDDAWDRSRRALSGWAVRWSSHPLEPDKTLAHPPVGPAAHLHRNVSWFGVPVISARRLDRQARRSSCGVRVPGRADRLRITVAHAVFQNLAFDLGELRSLRGLLDDLTVGAALQAASEEGWARSFRDVTDLVRRTVEELDGGGLVEVPARLPAWVSLRAGLEHGRYLARVGAWASGVGEIVLRPPLVAAKLRPGR